MNPDPREAFQSQFAALLADSGLQGKQVASRVNARRPRDAAWSVTPTLLSAWKNGRNLPSAAKEEGFLQVVRLMTEHARGRALRGHPVGQLLDEVTWTRLLKQARANPLPGASPQAEITAYLHALVEWLNTDPWPHLFDEPAPTVSAIERKLNVSKIGADSEILDGDDLASRCTRLVVLGDPGSGKTWFARRAARMCAVRALERLSQGDELDQVELPLYTTCANLSGASPGDDIRHAVVASALGQIPDLGSLRVAANVRAFFENRTASTLLALDSIDEAPGIDHRIRQADTLPDTWRILLTSRPGSWHRQLVINDNDPHRVVSVLRPLQYPGDVESFITQWFSTRPEQAAALARQLRDRPALQRGATVPLILAFYCIIGTSQPLPARRADLYAKVTKRLLTARWRGGEGIDPDPRAYLILRKWAWTEAVQGNSPVSGVGTWAEEFHAPRATQALKHPDALDHVATPLAPSDPDTGTTRRRFVHRSIREYLVAEHIALTMPAHQAATELISHLWYDPDWEYAAPAALAMHPHRDQVLNELMRLLPHAGQSRMDLAAIDGCWEVRRFLARVAQESREGDWTPEAAETIGRARLDLCMSRANALDLVVAVNDWPTGNSLILGSLLTLLDTDSWGRAERVKAISRLDLTAEDRARARQALLNQLATGRVLLGPVVWASAVARLAVTAEERKQVRQALLDLIAADPVWAVDLAGTVASLDPTARERDQVRLALHGLLTEHADPEWAGPITSAIATLDPTVRELERARRVLLGLLHSSGNPGTALDLAHAIDRLAPSAEERKQVRQALLDLLTSEGDPGQAKGLANTLATLDPKAEERDQIRLVLSGMLTAHPLWTVELVDAMAKLGLTARERDQVRLALHGLLTEHADPEWAGPITSAIATLDPTVRELERARRVLLGLLHSSGNPGTALDLAHAIDRLAPSAEERKQVRQALLDLLTDEADPRWASSLADEIATLDPTVQDQKRARQVLLGLLATEPRHANLMGAAVARLDPTEQEQVQSRRALLRLLADQTGAQRARWLADAAARLNPTVQDQERIRRTLVSLLARESGVYGVLGLADAISALNPTITDLNGSGNWPVRPSEALLAAVRRNSPASAWLSTLPLLGT